MIQDLFRIFTVTIIAVITRIVCTFLFGGDPISISEPFGNIAGQVGIIPSVIFMFFLSYLHLTIIGFIFMKRQLARNYKNGLLFGLFVGLLWLFGMFEAGIVKNIPQTKELIFGISEAIPIVILGLLISFILKNDLGTYRTEKIELIESVIIISVIAFVYIVVRYFSYIVIGIESKYLEKPFQTFSWTLGNGIVISLLYLYIRKFNEKTRILQNAFVFGILIFGVDWFLYNMFVPVFFNVSVFEIFRSYIIRSLMDIFSIFISIVIIEQILIKRHLTFG